MGEDINSIDGFLAAVEEARRQEVPEGSILNWVAAHFRVDQMTATMIYVQYRDAALKVGNGGWLIEKDAPGNGSQEIGRKNVGTTLRIEVPEEPVPVENHSLLLPVQPDQETKRVDKKRQSLDSSIPPRQTTVSTVQDQGFPRDLKEAYREPYALLRDNAKLSRPGRGWVVGRPQTILGTRYGSDRGKILLILMRRQGWLDRVEDAEISELGLALEDLGHGHGRYFWLRFERDGSPRKKKMRTSKKLHQGESPEGLTPCRQEAWDALRSGASEYDPKNGWRVQHVNRILTDVLGKQAGHTVFQWLRGQGILVSCDEHIGRGGATRPFWLRSRDQLAPTKRSSGVSTETGRETTLEAMERQLATLSRRVESLETIVASLRTSRDSDVG